MKLHLPARLFRAVIALMTAVPVLSYSVSSSAYAADMALGADDPLTIDYADTTTVQDVDGTLQLLGETPLVLSNCGEGDGKTYTLFTGVSALLDAKGNELTLTDDNNAISKYFDTTQPGTGFWKNATLELTDGTLQFVLHSEDVDAALNIATRQTSTLVYEYYKGISFKNITSSDAGGAIYGESGSTITLSNNGSVTFSGNTAGTDGGAIWGDTIELSHNGSVTFSENTAGTDGGAIWGNTIELNHNGSVTFSGNTAGYCDYGGAIWGNTIELSHNGSVTFSGNKAGDYGNGGAIWGNTIKLSHNGSVTFSQHKLNLHYSGGAIWGDTIELSHNGTVIFEENAASQSGGAIHGKGTIELSHNGSVEFSGNTAGTDGGAIFGQNYVGNITLSYNGSVEFSGNTAGEYGGAIWGLRTLSHNGSVKFSGNTAGTGGGAIGGSHTLSHNDEVTFSGNKAGTGGGAIFGNGTIILSNNDKVTFSGNTAGKYGGAIWVEIGALSIQNNSSVLFEKNVTLSDNVLKLQSICVVERGVNPSYVDFSSPQDSSIEFRDSVYIQASGFNLNAPYKDESGNSIAQTGDIIFTGADVTADKLKAILSQEGIDRDVTEDEIKSSKTSVVLGAANLYDGRLIIKEGAVWSGKETSNNSTIYVHSSASGATDVVPTLLLQDGKLDKVGIQVKAGGALRLAGCNTVADSTITMQDDSCLVIDVDGVHASSTGALTLSSGNLALDGKLNLVLTQDEKVNNSSFYKLISGVSQVPTEWTADNITVTSGTPGREVSFDDLSWVGDTLWLYLPKLKVGTWTNESTDGLWNTTSLNWKQEGVILDGVYVAYAYEDGVEVKFGDEGAGTVTLVGDIAPESVLVDSTKEYIWNADETEGGKLTGSMSLTKQGEGKLTINTANDYTGGTEISGGTLVAATGAALGSGTVELKGGELEIAATGVSNHITVTGAAMLDIQSSGELVLNRAMEVEGGGSLTLTGSGSITVSSDLRTGTDETYVDCTQHDSETSLGGENGFYRAAGSQLMIADGALAAGTDYSGTITCEGLEYHLDAAGGMAYAHGAVSYGAYLMQTADATAAVSDIVDAAATGKVTSTAITVNAGTLVVDGDITGDLTTTGGTLKPEAKTGGYSVAGAMSLGSGTMVDVAEYTTEGLHTLLSTESTRSGDVDALTLTGANADAALLGTEKSLLLQLGNAMSYDGTQGALIDGMLEGKDVTITGETEIAIEVKDSSTDKGKVSVNNTTSTLSGDNSYSGGTTLENATLVAASNTALGTGVLESKGNDMLSINDGVDLQLKQTIKNTSGTFTMAGEGNLVPDAGLVEEIAESRVTVEQLKDISCEGGTDGFVREKGSKVQVVDSELSKSGFSGDVTLNGEEYELHTNGYAYNHGGVDYSHYLVSEHEVLVSDIHAAVPKADNGQPMTATSITLQAASHGMRMTSTSGTLVVDADITGDLTTAGGTLQIKAKTGGYSVAGAMNLGSGTMVDVAEYTTEGLHTLLSTESTRSGDVDHLTPVGAKADAALLGTEHKLLLLVGNNLNLDDSEEVIFDGTLDGKNISATKSATLGAYVTGSSSLTVKNATVALTGRNDYSGATMLTNAELTTQNELGDTAITLNNSKLHTPNIASSRHRLTVEGNSVVTGALTLCGGTITMGSGSRLSVEGNVTINSATSITLSGLQEARTLISYSGTLTGDPELLTLEVGQKGWGLEFMEGGIMLKRLGSQEDFDCLVQGNWGVFTASHAFMGAAMGRHVNARAIAEGQGSVWFDAMGSFRRISNSGSMSGSDINLWGGTLGAEMYCNAKHRFGVAMGYVFGEVQPTRSAHEVEQDGSYIGLYAEHTLWSRNKNTVSISWGAAYGCTESEGTLVDEKRSWEQNSVQLNARATWSRALSERSAVSAFGGLEYYANDSDTLPEGGKTGSIQNLRAEIGAGINHTVGRATFYGEAAFLSDLARNNPHAALYELPGYGTNPGRLGVGVKAGVQYDLGHGWNVGASYNLEAMENAQEHNVNVGASYSF